MTTLVLTRLLAFWKRVLLSFLIFFAFTSAYVANQISSSTQDRLEKLSKVYAQELEDCLQQNDLIGLRSIVIRLRKAFNSNSIEFVISSQSNTLKSRFAIQKIYPRIVSGNTIADDSFFVDLLSHSTVVTSNGLELGSINLTVSEEDFISELLLHIAPFLFAFLGLTLLIVIVATIGEARLALLVSKYIDSINYRLDSSQQENPKDTIDFIDSVEIKDEHYRDTLQKLGKRIDEVSIRLFEAREDRIRFEEQTKISKQVIHDLRSPMSALESLGSEIAEDQSEIKASVNMVSDRIKEIVSDLRNTEIRQSLNSSNRVSRVYSPCLELEKILLEKQLEYSSRSDVDLVWSNKDSLRSQPAIGLSSEFKRAISNLVNNSIEAKCESRNSVTVQAFCEDRENELVVTIRDNGRGIRSDLVPRIRERGFTSEKPEGSGLGLTFAYEFAKSSGGVLTVDSKVGNGTIVELRLPKYKRVPNWRSEIFATSDTQIVLIAAEGAVRKHWNKRFGEIDPALIDQLIIFDSLGDFIDSSPHEKMFLERIILIDDSSPLELAKFDNLKECLDGDETILFDRTYGQTDSVELANQLGIRHVPSWMRDVIELEYLSTTSQEVSFRQEKAIGV